MVQPKIIIPATTTRTAMRITVRGVASVDIRAKPTADTTYIHMVDVCASAIPVMRSTKRMGMSPKTIPKDAGSERASTFTKKWPFNRS